MLQERDANLNAAPQDPKATSQVKKVEESEGKSTPADDVVVASPTSPIRPVAFRRKPFIALAGLIGAGKTTLSTGLSKQLGLPLFEEPVASNSILADFYQDMGKHGFHLQIHLLNIRFQQHQKIVWNDDGGVSDRSIYEDSIFAKLLWKAGLMSEKEYMTYVSLFQNMSKFLKQPTVIVYLDVSPQTAMDRIHQRGRSMEKGISQDYLKGLHEGYEEFINEIAKSIPVIRVPWDEFDDIDLVVSKLVKVMEQLNHVVVL